VVVIHCRNTGDCEIESCSSLFFHDYPHQNAALGFDCVTVFEQYTGMIKDFIIGSTWEDIVRYTVICVVLTAMSPYGIFIIRYLFAWITGAPTPYIVTKKQTAKQAISELEKVATDRMRQMADVVEKLQQSLEEATSINEALEAENEALKRHIRHMCGDRSESSDHQNEWSYQSDPKDSYASDFAVLGLRSHPRPTWDEVKKAYRAAAKEHHPDNPEQSGSDELFKRINAANENLKVLYGKK
jgi:DnaJ-domain-containing protein 1